MALGALGQVVSAGVREAAPEYVQEKLLPGIWGIFYRGVPKLALARNPPGVCRGATHLCRESEGVPRILSSFVPQDRRFALGESKIRLRRNGGSRGLKRDRTDYPPLRGHDEAWPSEVAERCSGTLPGVLGVPPNPLFSIPQEWGIRRLTKPPMATEPSSPPGSGRTR